MTHPTLTPDTTKETNFVNEIKSLNDRVDQLELSADFTSSHMEVLIELLKIIVEIPAGKQIYNRALNRQHLNRLRNVVLPRRNEALAALVADESDMPEPIQRQFVDDQMKLIKAVTNSIIHREHFEQQAATNVRNLLTNLFTKIKNSNFNVNNKLRRQGDIMQLEFKKQTDRSPRSIRSHSKSRKEELHAHTR
jgi:hypothetical protein